MYTYSYIDMYIYIYICRVTDSYREIERYEYIGREKFHCFYHYHFDYHYSPTTTILLICSLLPLHLFFPFLSSQNYTASTRWDTTLY